MNKVTFKFKSRMENEAFARISACAFLSPLNPNYDEMMEIKTIVSEAVTNAIIHGYENEIHKIWIEAEVEGETITVSVEDFGKGIPDIQKALEPMYTTRRDLERSGMGFVFMEAFMDTVKVESEVGKGTKVTMTKRVGKRYGTDL